MEKYLKAMREKTINSFFIKAIGWILQFDGVLKILNGAIHFKVPNGLERIVALDLNTQRFNINFNSNLTSFSVQHNAISWMKEHRLFQKLIENDRYESKSSVNEKTNQNAYEFR